jgi:hypothetical protein
VATRLRKSDSSPPSHCGAWSPQVNPDIIPTAARRLPDSVRRTATLPARSARATAALFAFGSLLTLVDAVMTSVLLRTDGMTERWAPVRLLMDAVGVDLALAIASMFAIGAMAIVAWGAVRGRSIVASASFIVLCAVVSVRVFGCVNNVGVMVA